MICESGSDFVLNIETVLMSVMFHAAVLPPDHRPTQAKDRLYGQIAGSLKKLGYGSRRGVDSDLKKVSVGTCKGNCAWSTFRCRA